MNLFSIFPSFFFFNVKHMNKTERFIHTVCSQALIGWISHNFSYVHDFMNLVLVSSGSANRAPLGRPEVLAFHAMSNLASALLHGIIDDTKLESVTIILLSSNLFSCASLSNNSCFLAKTALRCLISPLYCFLSCQWSFSLRCKLNG